VIVKFSPPRSTGESAQRWSDLLVAESLALDVLGAAGVCVSKHQIRNGADRTYLEVERFDRTPGGGRVGVSSLFAIELEFYGKLDTWTASAERLCRDERIDEHTLEQIRLLSCFGNLIGNTDMHFGNLAFFNDYRGRFRLAPIYDMLPMLFAPGAPGTAVPAFARPAPAPHLQRVWDRARALAETYWRMVGRDSRVSAAFRDIAQQCAAQLSNPPPR
jgi:serine/threonine protein kinase HipA of HipAB toxin-antitoxin module